MSTTVTGTFKTADGTAAEGSVRFTPGPSHIVDAANNVVIIADTLTATLDEDGSFSIDLLPTDDASVLPVDWTYTVVVEIGGTDRYYFYCNLPTGAEVDIADLTPISESLGLEPNVVVLTQAQYDELDPPNPTVLYFII